VIVKWDLGLIDLCTIDNIHTIKQIYEKYYECHTDLHNVFVDFKHAFDSVNRSLISKCLEEYKIPRKLIRLTALTLKNTTAKVKKNNELSESLIVNTGVKQGDPLSALLFSVIMDQVLKSLDIRGNISTRLRQVCAYANDILIMTRTKQALADSFIKLNEEAQKAGLVINVNKIKYMKCSRNQVKQQIVDLGGTEFGNIQSFKYLGSM
jgi:hypothetical protein